MDREAAYAAAGRSEHARRIVELLFASGREADVAQIKEAFGTKDPNPALKLLRDKGILTLETSASRGVGDKKELVASLALSLIHISPSFEELSRRLHRRATDAEEVIQGRLQKAREECKQIPNYDYLVVNDKVSEAAGEIIASLTAESFRTKHRINLVCGV